MLKTLLYVFIAFLSGSVYSQKITGTVFDKISRNAIPNASVFLNGSSSGTLTTATGDFVLWLPENERLPVVVSCIGYETIIYKEYPRNARFRFFLSPKIYALGEVTISAKASREQKRSRQANLEIFRGQFLGNSVNAASCKILNEKDLVLKVDPRTEILSARSDKPLIIENKALGYRITYLIEKFEFSMAKQTLYYAGYYSFKELPGLSEIQLKQAVNRRRLAYFGSRTEFFRSLWHNNLDSAGYDLRTTSNKKLTYDSLVFESNTGSKFWKYPDPVIIHHFSKTKITTIQAHDSIYFDRLGYFDPEGFDWWKSGEMTLQRIGDLLPVDYRLPVRGDSIGK